ncbi:MAG: NAD-dependent epimerase [Pirellulaceae bacterium]|jgi:UDP-glucuronate 4-epimerase|nr:NAD-dependent epimerase [Pirellulaceae bacterium]
MRQILVTGTAGFIGFHLAKALLAAGEQVVGVDNLNPYYNVQLKRDRLQQLDGLPGFTQLEFDLSNRQAVARLFAERRFDRVVHLAAQAGVRYSLTNPQAYVDSNLVAFVNLLEGCRNSEVGHLLYASSSSVYGANKQQPFSTHHNVDHPLSLYAATKKANELMAHTYSHLYQLPTTGLRFFTVYGPWGRPDMAAYLFTKAIFEERPIDVFNHGDMRRDFTYIDDITQALVGLIDVLAEPTSDFDASHPDPSSSPTAPYRLYNIGNNQPESLEHFIEVLETCIGRKALKNYLDLQPGDVVETYADISDLERHIGFRPTTSIEQGLAHFVNWYRAYHLTV